MKLGHLVDSYNKARHLFYKIVQECKNKVNLFDVAYWCSMSISVCISKADDFIEKT